MTPFVLHTCLFNTRHRRPPVAGQSSPKPSQPGMATRSPCRYKRRPVHTAAGCSHGTCCPGTTRRAGENLRPSAPPAPEHGCIAGAARPARSQFCAVQCCLLGAAESCWVLLRAAGFYRMLLGAAMLLLGATACCWVLPAAAGQYPSLQPLQYILRLCSAGGRRTDCREAPRLAAVETELRLSTFRCAARGSGSRFSAGSWKRRYFATGLFAQYIDTLGEIAEDDCGGASLGVSASRVAAGR